MNRLYGVTEAFLIRCRGGHWPPARKNQIPADAYRRSHTRQSLPCVKGGGFCRRQKTEGLNFTAILTNTSAFIDFSPDTLWTSIDERQIRSALGRIRCRQIPQSRNRATSHCRLTAPGHKKRERKAFAFLSSVLAFTYLPGPSPVKYCRHE